MVIPFSTFISKTSTAGASASSLAVLPVEKKKSYTKTNQTARPPARWRDGELLVRFKQNSSDSEIEALLQASGAQRLGRLRGKSNIEKLRLSPGTDPLAIASIFSAAPVVEFAEPNYTITADEITPNDPRFVEQWALKNTGGAGGNFGSDINAARGWGMAIGSRRTVIAVIDSGVDLTHVELRSNRWDNLKEQANRLDDDRDGFTDDLQGWDFVTETGVIRDEHGHGTAVAGVIAARGHNGIGITGLMWRASLMSLRVLDSTGKGEVAHAVEAIDYAAQHGAKVLNCSFGTEENSVALREAINRVAQQGVIVVASAGNNSRDIETKPHYPASFDLPNLISVASTDNTDLLTPFSNWGMTHVAIAAPGTGILTTKMGGDYQTISGSSASAPFVTGVAGLIKTLRPWLSANRTREMILRGARHVPVLTDKVAAKGVLSAAGTLNALNALPRNEGLTRGSEGFDGNDDSNENGGSNQQDNLSDMVNGNGIAHREGSGFRFTPPPRTQGTPGPGLPDLDELRRKEQIAPKASEPVPSTRCSPRRPDCLRPKPAPGQLPTELLAAALRFPSLDPLLVANSGLISDSPFKLFRAAKTSVSASSYPQTSRANAALAANGSVASASSIYPGYPLYAGAAIDGDRKGLNYPQGGVWQDAQPSQTFPDWLQVNFPASKTIDEINLFTLQNNYANPVEPLESTTFTYYGLTGFDIQYWNGASWVNVPGGNITGNDKVWRKLTFPALTTNKIRVLTNASADGYSRVTEIEAWGPADSSSAQNVIWTNTVGVTATGNNLFKPSGGWWDAGAVSVQTIASGDGYVEFTVSETNKHRICGLSSGDASQSWDDIDFALYLHDSGYLKVYEGGSYRGQFGTYSAGDHLRVSVESGVVKYSKNGTVFYTSTVAPTYPLLVDTSLYSAGATISNAIISGQGVSNSFSIERVDPKNRTGIDGVDLLSRNVHWRLPILGLKGRAGLNLELALSYNSLVWTKSQDGTSIKFDADSGTPSPGFRLGFPTIQTRHFNPQIGVNAYLLTTSSGGHTELRQVGTSNVYEAGDSSYLQLIDGGNGTLTLRTTEGSHLSYALLNGQYQCTRLRDRNGNYLTISYFSDGRINTITDTLARVVNFNYDPHLNLISISQIRGGVPHQWATFGWTDITVNPNFSNLAVIGMSNNTTIPVLNQVSFADGTRYSFEYNSYAQVAVVRHFAADNHQLAYTSYTHTLPAGADDCPRVTEQKVSAEYWTGENSLPAEVLTQYSTATDYSSGQMSMPDGNIYKELYAGTANWQRGLATGTELWANGIKKKWTTAAYTQDDTNLPYQKNPRVTETNVYDVEGNRKRVVIEYGEYAEWGLPSRVIEYAPNATTELRQTVTSYNLDPAYTSRRIIGLVDSIRISDTSTWQSIIQYAYDAGGDQLVATPSATVQHDAAYDTGFTLGRGNLTAITRYDVKDIDNAGKRAVTQVGYDTNGSIVFTRDPLNRQTNLSYTDSFSDNLNRNTFAYPSKFTPPLATGENPDNFSSSAQYNYDLGIVTRSQGPVVAGQTQGAIQTMEFDAAGRISRVNNLVNNAYRRWVYDPAGHISVYTTVQAGGPETFSTTVFDGAGRVRATSGDNPNSTGGYSAQFKQYDLMGRVFKQSHPTEVTLAWAAAGDDAGGVAWMQQAYDWKGRPTLTINTDGTTKEVIYGGCGCAGGEVITTKDELDRRQRITLDVRGRVLKTEILNWDAEHSVYSTTTNSYNSLDQITSVHEQGNNVAGQLTTLTYDGHGRLQIKKTPAQTYATTYFYNPDDTLQSVTDGRGAVSAFTYNSRQQPVNISYSAPYGVAATAPVTINYDSAGNRTSISDGSGSASYSYDPLSRLTSESRQFTGLSGTYTLSYTYNLANELTSIADPTGAAINYSYDKSGRMTDITGSPFAGVTQYASNVRYRAWGAVKSAAYGDSTQLAIGYNQRLLPTEMSVTNQLSKRYQYHADGRLRYSQDLGSNSFDRSYVYDHVGRVIAASSGPKARGLADIDERPYDLTYQYDALNRLISRAGKIWSGLSDTNVGSGVYADDKNTGWQYDLDGRLTNSLESQYSYDAAGRAISIVNTEGELTQEQVFNSDGERTRLYSQQVIYHEDETVTTQTKTQYFVSSSVLGGVVTELDQNGQKTRTFVYQGGEVLAWQQKSGSTETIAWEHRDLSNASIRISAGGSAELEPLGSNAGLFNPFVLPPAPKDELTEFRTYPGFTDAASSQCRVDGVDMPCSMVNDGGYAQCPNNDCGPKWNADKKRFEQVQAFADGHVGYLPLGAKYRGRGRFKEPGRGDQPYSRLTGYRALDSFGLRFSDEIQQNPTPQLPDPKEVERLIKSCLLNISIVPEDIYNAIANNKRDVQSLVLSLAHAATESGFLPDAVGGQNEIGLFQLKLSTANSLGLGTYKRDQLFDPALNTQLGTTHLQNLINSFNGDVRTALGAYKQGETGVRKRGLSKASQEYADGILGCERKILGR